MEKIKVQDAVGAVLIHDMTQIIPGVSKGPRFRKGHVVSEEDIPVLLSMGKEHIYVWDQIPGLVHENEAAIRLAKAAAGFGLTLDSPKEGKVTFTAAQDGLLYVSEEGVLALNSIENVVLATLHTHRPVKKGDKIAGTRVVSLMIDEKVILEAEQTARTFSESLIEARPLRPFRSELSSREVKYITGTIERVFADAKEKHGMRYTRLRGLKKAKMQVTLIFACMNLKKLATWKRRKGMLPFDFGFS